MKQQTFLKGAVILTIAGFLNRILGFFLRVVMVHYLGDEGVGLYSMIYPVYITLILLSTVGFPVAIAKLVSEKNAQKDVRAVMRILKTSIIFLLGTSLTMTIILVCSARWIAINLLSDIRTYRLLLAIAPSLVFVTMASVFRSYFQGLKTMTPTAVSQTIEQLIRIVASVFFITFLTQRGIQYGATGAALGITMGEFSGIATLLVIFVIHRIIRNGNDLLSIDIQQAPQTTYSFPQAFKDLFKLGLPITIGRLVISLMYTIDAILIPSQLQRGGLTIAEATSQFGQLTGIALQIIFLPTIISTALTTSLVPSIADALARNQLQKIRDKYHEVLRITFYIGFPASLFFIFRGSQICILLFDFPEAGILLTLLGLGAISTYFIHVAGGVLNGLGKPHLAVKNLIIGASFKLGFLLTLVSHPLFGIKGAALSLAIGWIVSSIADFISIGRIIGFGMNFYHLLIKPLAGCVLIYLLLPLMDSLAIFLGLTPKLVTLFTLIISAIVYLIWMIIIKGISKEDLKKFKQ